MDPLLAGETAERPGASSVVTELYLLAANVVFSFTGGASACWAIQMTVMSECHLFTHIL